MAERLATLLRGLLILLAVTCISAKRFSIMAPNIFHIGVKEQVSISVFDADSPVTVKLYLQDYPHRKKTFSQVEGRVVQGRNIFLPVKVEPENLPDTASVDKQYVYLVAKSDDAHFQFEEEARILLSYKDGMVFIQTDKPIYTPRQIVKIQVIPLEFDMKPSQRQITVIVENPQGIRVEEWDDLDTITGIISKTLPLEDFVLLGNWTVTAMYGHRNIHNTSVQFEVKEYVLPKFSVKIDVPPYVLKTDDLININITTRYTYGKPVIGTARVLLSIAGPLTIPFARYNMLLNNSGVTFLRERLHIIRELPGNLWFPEGQKLQVEVDVIERVTGNKESATDKSCPFTSTPYSVEFKNTPKYFKPGFGTIPVKVLVTHPNRQPAVKVQVLLTAEGKKADGTTIVLSKFDRDGVNAKGYTDDSGEAEFRVDSCSGCHTITIQIKTNDENLEIGQNAVANYIVKPFHAQNEKNQMLLARQTTNRGKVGKKMDCEFVRNHEGGNFKLSFAVVSRGRILSHNTTDFDEKTKSWSFRITPQMSPSARLIGYYIGDNERVVADSILLEVEDTLPTKVDFPDAYVEAGGSTVELNEKKLIPGDPYVIKIKAPQGTRLGILGVDKSVYLLRSKNTITKERIFKTAEELDLGCGAGGGKDNKDIFKNAGVVFMTDNFVSDGREEYGCKEDKPRKKRSMENDIDDKICCEMAKQNQNMTCYKLARDSNKGLTKRCRRTFWECCTKLYGKEDTALLGRSGFDNDDYPTDEDINQVQVRSYFPETWINAEEVVGSNGLVQIGVSIPHTITTWVMQAVAINNKTGLGLATPFRIVGYQDYFISLKMPYSVKRGEQVSLLATVFSYLESDDDLVVKLYIMGSKDYCSIATNGKLGLIGTVIVPANDARSVAVPIVPKRTGEIEVEVWSFYELRNFIGAGKSGDAVKRKLLVLPEGKEHRKSQTFILDPSGSLIDNGDDNPNKPTQPSGQGQGSIKQFIIDLRVPERAIPKSVAAAVYVTGNLLGPVVNTTIEGGLEGFLRMPTGCGEQTMIYLAPNVYVLEYLTNTKQLTGAHEENAYRFIQSGYARELNYRRDDNSFSAFGNDRKGSTWLTAFVMRVFCHAQQFDGVRIDNKLMCESVDWLINNQREDGALPEVFAVIHGEMVGGVYSDGEVAMTAFVLTTLAECQCQQVNSQEAIRKAKEYLEKKYRTLSKPYTMALTAYALSLVNSGEKHNANNRLAQNAVYDNVKKSRYWNTGRGNALDVETAGYALLTQMILGRTSYAGPIVTYLTNQRKGGVGFVSTQDTVVALQALSLYSEKTVGNAMDLRVKLSSENWMPPEIHITSENALLRRDFDVTNLIGGELSVDTEGTGAGLLEVELRYNLPSSRNETCKFHLTTNVIEIKDEAGDDPGSKDGGRPQENGNNNKNGGNRRKKCNRRNRDTKKCRNKNKNKKNEKPPPKHQPVKKVQLKVCTRYLGKTKTGMSILDIGILTGFELDEVSKRKIKNLTVVDKVEVSDRALVIYLSEIPHDRELCINVELERAHLVGAVQEVPVNVYDYYEPDESCTVFYGPYKSSPLKLGVCDVGHDSCKCSQDECPQHDPGINKDNIAKLINIACRTYHYVIKGKVLLISEDNTRLEYMVRVKQIIKQGNKELKERQKIWFRKRGACRNPDLKEKHEYLFMGKDEGGYELDKSAFVKHWPRRPENNKDKVILEDFAKRFSC